MTTISFKVFKHHKKSDGLINVKLVVYHDKKRVYLNTVHYVTSIQLKKDYTIRDKDLLVILAEERAIYLRRISNLGEQVYSLSAKEIGTIIMGKALKEKPLV